MGNRDNDKLITLLDQKNAEIQRLNAEILAYSARTSNLQTRLLQTIDVLDETQRTHARELEEIERKYVRLEQRSRRHIAILNASETERSELRESVLELVEKVEQSNDIRSWPVNRLQLTRFTEHPRQSEIIKQLPIDEKLAYAGAIIDQLRRERDNEREAHTYTTEALQSKIDLLVTQLARRDTELEYYATHTTHTRIPAFLPGHDTGSVSFGSSQGKPSPNEVRKTGLLPEAGQEGEREVEPTIRGLINEEIIKMLSTTAARNRSLEVEIKTLFKRLEQARSRSTSSPLASSSKVRSSPRPRSQPRSRPGNVFTPLGKNDIPVDGASNNWDRDVPGERKEYEDGDRASNAQQHHLRIHTPSTKGLSRTKTHSRAVTSSNQNMHVVNYSQRLDPDVRHSRKGGAKRDAYGENEEFNRDQHQNMGSPIRGHQSIPVSESIDDGNRDNDDGGDVGIDLETRARADGHTPPLAWDDTSPGFGDLEGSGVNCGHLQVRTSARGSVARPKSATLAGLDEQIRDLATQIDSFRREREALLEFVAAQKQHQHRRWDREGDPGVISSPCFSVVSRLGDDRSDGGYPTAAVEENVPAEHGNDQDEDNSIEIARIGALGTYEHRLNVIEHECLRLRHELNECRLESEMRENELLEEIRLLHRRVEELDVQCRAQPSRTQEPSTTEIPYSSHENHSGSSQHDSEHEQEDQLQQSLQVESVSPLCLASALVPGTTVEDNHIGPITPPDIIILPTAELNQPSSPATIAELPPNHTQFPWLQLNDSELDGLLDAIDGEASMELATPLMPTSLLDREGEDSRVHFGSNDGTEYRDQEDDRDQDRSEELMIWDELDERLNDSSQPRSGSGYENDDDRGEASEGGSRSESRNEESVYSDDVAEREHREGQQRDVLGQDGWMMRGDDDGANGDDLPEALTQTQLEREGTEEEPWGDDDGDDDHEDRPDERHYMHGREDSYNTHISQREQQEVLEANSTGSSTRNNTRFRGLGVEFIFPQRPATFSTTQPDSRSRSRSHSRSPSPSSSASPTEVTEQLRRELERAERELMVAQEMLEQGEEALRDVEATVRMSSFSSPSSER